ncbi:mitochondrial import inner membrane translocase subunit tim54 [Arachnomyces sp. PD_36]|nr:mitochondrial import inner membrane translocase subunit tim54 [Arachnomyces sp. PD_36]
MAENTASSQNAPKPPPSQNPAFKMMGLPNFRFKLPSRNWLIFLTITGSFTSALIYDRRQKKQAQRKWCDLVAHLAKEPLPTDQRRRKLTVFLSPPPGDGLRSAREYFQEYVKPVLVSAALDYEVVEGRREGDVRSKLADKIRKQRRNAGEQGTTVVEMDGEEAALEMGRQRGIEEESGPKGDLVVGRHTWKEYIRGLHEGWLGPLDAPPEPEPEPAPVQVSTPEEPPADTNASDDDASPVIHDSNASKPETKPDTPPEQPPKPTGPPPAYILPSAYSSQPLPPSFPQTLPETTPLPLPHILGFLNTPIRIYRFLTQRYVADNVGRDVAALVLAMSSRPYQEGAMLTSDSTPNAEFTSESPSSSSTPESATTPQQQTYEQQTLFQNEEKEWHKSVHKREDDGKEREWLDDIILDPRIASRMNRFTLPADEEERANRIAEGKEWVRGEDKPVEVSFWKNIWDQYGWAEDPNKKKEEMLKALSSESED